jgi:hypothetical protein
MAPLILNLRTGWRSAVNSMSRPMKFTTPSRDDIKKEWSYTSILPRVQAVASFTMFWLHRNITPGY